jgi:hypothetical protein
VRDEVTILRDLFLVDDHENVVFKKGRDYEIVGENKDEIFIARDRESGCHAIPKQYEGDIFQYK